MVQLEAGAVRHAMPLGWTAPAIGLAVFAAALLKGPAALGDPDIQWHIEAGRWIAAHKAVPAVDPFSHSLPGAPWHAHEWLAELLFWWVFRLAGWTGVAVTAAAAAGFAFAAFAHALSRHLQPRHVLLLCAAAFAVASQHLLARPHILAWPILVLWVAALCGAADRRVAPHPAWLLLMAVWANLHAGHAFGLALAGLFALEAVWQAPAAERLSVMRRWGLFVGGAGLASLATPHPPMASLGFALGFLDGSGFTAPISEWQPADFRKLSGIQLTVLGLLALALLGRLRLPPWRALLLVLLVQMALAHVRHGELLGLVAPLALAGSLATWLYGDAGERGGAAATGRRMWLPAVALAGALALLAGRSELRPPASVTPMAALESARAAGLLDQPVLNAFDFGGYLILSGVPVFVDGRADFFGSEFLNRYLDAVLLRRAGALEAVLGEGKIGWTLLQPGTPAILLLDRLPGWERIHADAVAVVHRRVPAGQGGS